MEEGMISWNSSEYETEEERDKAIREFKNQMQTFFNETVCSYEEYKIERNDLTESIIKYFLLDDDTNCIYMVKSKFNPSSISPRKDFDVKNPFSKGTDALDFVRTNELNENYEVNDFIWWEIDKYCLVEEKYNRLYSVLLDTEGKVLELNYSYDDIDKFSSHQKDVLEWFKQFGYGKSRHNKTVQYQYAAGDIIRISHKPFDDSYSYYVYSGYGKDVFKEGYFDELISLYFLSFMCHTEGYYHKICAPEDFTIVDSCPNEVLNKFSIYLKNNPTYYSTLSSDLNENYDKVKNDINELAKTFFQK